VTTPHNGSNGWKPARLGNLIDLFDSQRVPLNSRERQERQGDYPYYGAQGIIDYIDDYIFDGRYILVAEDGENLNSKKLPLALFATGKFWVNNHAHILRGKLDVIDDTFLLACLNNADVRPFVTGAAQPKLSQANLRQIEVPLPPLPTQRRIAGILSAYDELIENCQRRIRILEEMARALYREWFVHFRFPAHEKIPRVNSTLGPIPDGWEIKPLFDLAEVKYGKNLPTKLLSDDSPYPVYGAAKVIGRHTEYTREQRTIICGCRGSVGEMQITLPQCFVTNNSFTFDSNHTDNFFWLFHILRGRGLRDVVGGAAQPQITLDGISSVELLTPPLALRNRFQRTVAPMFEQAWTFDRKIQNLRRTRDLLLPRLLSGQVSLDVSAVEDAEGGLKAAPRLSSGELAR
jgi:type I restriction enzyme S subunit